MNNLKKTFLFLLLLSVAKPAIAGGISASSWFAAAPTAPASTSWASSAASAISNAGSAAVPALGVVGSVAASTLIPFGLGPIASVAAPYAIASVANYVTKKISGVDIARLKYEEELRDEVSHLTKMMERRDRKYERMMEKARKLRRKRKQREMMCVEEDMDEEDEEREEELEDNR